MWHILLTSRVSTGNCKMVWYDISEDSTRTRECQPVMSIGNNIGFRVLCQFGRIRTLHTSMFCVIADWMWNGITLSLTMSTMAHHLPSNRNASVTAMSLYHILNCCVFFNHERNTFFMPSPRDKRQKHSISIEAMVDINKYLPWQFIRHRRLNVCCIWHLRIQ